MLFDRNFRISSFRSNLKERFLFAQCLSYEYWKFIIRTASSIPKFCDL